MISWRFLQSLKPHRVVSSDALYGPPKLDLWAVVKGRYRFTLTVRLSPGDVALLPGWTAPIPAFEPRAAVVRARRVSRGFVRPLSQQDPAGTFQAVHPIHGEARNPRLGRPLPRGDEEWAVVWSDPRCRSVGPDLRSRSGDESGPSRRTTSADWSWHRPEAPIRVTPPGGASGRSAAALSLRASATRRGTRSTNGPHSPPGRARGRTPPLLRQRPRRCQAVAAHVAESTHGYAPPRAGTAPA